MQNKSAKPSKPSIQRTKDNAVSSENSRNSIKKRSNPKEKALSVLANTAQNKIIDPAQYFDGQKLWFGFRLKNNILVLNSNREIYMSEDLPSGYVLRHKELDKANFSQLAITNYINSESSESPEKVFTELNAFFRKYIVFDDNRIFSLLTVWTIGTYAYSIFRVFPYLALRSATKQCGKSRTLDVLSGVCFNADPRTTSPTEASLFRTVDKNGGTMFLDEIEGLKNDRDRQGIILSVLNTGFEQGGFVYRNEKRGNKWVQVQYSTYSPKALAGISKLASTLESRAIILYLKRKRHDEPVERYSRVRLHNETQAIKDALYIWSLDNALALSDIYDNQVADYSGLNSLGDRERDLWEPLVSIALALAQNDRCLDSVVSDLVSLASDLCRVKTETEEEAVIKLIRNLDELLGDEDSIDITPTELLAFLRTKGTIIGSGKALAQRMAPLGLSSVPAWNSNGQKSMRAYRLTRALIEDLKARYGQIT